MHSIALVHLGDTFFDYINDCIEQIQKFNTCSIYLIADKAHKNRVSDKVHFIQTDCLVPSNKHNIFNQNTTLNKTFRKGFWKYATERFFFIEELMTTFNLENVFHLENDNLLYCDIRCFLQIFTEEYDFAAVADNDIRIIPGFIYVKDSEKISDFTSFILENNGRNDMELLALYKRATQKVKNLPILPSNYDSELRALSGQTTTDKNLYFLNYEKFKSIFDGAAIGQYLGGVDPRNPEGNILNYVNESCLFNTAAFTYEFKTEGTRKVPYMQYRGQEIRINNLHIHSKNLKRFM